MPEKHKLEAERLAALHQFEILDTAVEAEFEDITRLAAYICGTPIAVISLVDQDRQWFKSAVGTGAREIPRDLSFCAHAILQSGLFIVPDALQDARFAENPLVAGETPLQFYAGVVLETNEGYPLGTLCVLDHKPRELSEAQKQSLAALSRQVMKLIECQKAAREVERLNERLQRTVTESHHRIKNSLQVIAALIDLQMGEDDRPLSPDVLHRLSHHVRAVSAIHDLLTDQAKAGKTEAKVSASAALEKLLPVLQGMTTGHRLHTRLEDIALTLSQVRALTLLVNELISNAVKHGGPGDIEILLTVAGQRGQLEVLDGGQGFPDNFDPVKAANTGLELIDILSTFDLQGDIAYLNRFDRSGGRVVVTFPLSTPDPEVE